MLWRDFVFSKGFVKIILNYWTRHYRYNPYLKCCRLVWSRERLPSLQQLEMSGRWWWELLRWEFCTSCFLYQSLVHHARKRNHPPNFYLSWRAFHPDAKWPERVFNSICKLPQFEMLYRWPLHLPGSRSKGSWPLYPHSQGHLRLLNSDWLVCVWRRTCNIPGMQRRLKLWIWTFYIQHSRAHKSPQKSIV